MKQCSKGHSEIIHDEAMCPLCEAISDHDKSTEKYLNQIDELKVKADDLEVLVKKLEEQIFKSEE